MPDPGQEARRKARVRRALTDPAYFGEMYLRPYDPAWTTPMPRHGREMLAQAIGNPNSITMLPPEYAKTTWMSQLLPIWLTLSWTARGKILRGFLMSEEENMAKGNLRVIATNLLENERILADFVDESGRPIVRKSTKEEVWNDGQIIVERPGTSKEPTWVAKGLDSKGIHGRRLDWAIVDDIITPSSGESPQLRERAKVVFDLVLRERIVATGHIAVVGNFISEKDLLHELSRRENWVMTKRPSMHLPDQPSVAPEERDLLRDDIQLLWPDVWPRERLLQRYREAPNRFRRVHLMDPHADGGERLQTDWVRLIEDAKTPLASCDFYMSIDPNAGGETDDLDYGVVTVGAVHPLGIDVVESYSVRGDPGRLAALAGILYDRWNRIGNGVRKLGMSKVSLDQVFSALLKEIRPDLHMIAEGIHAPGDKETRLEALGGYAQAGTFRVWEEVWVQQTSAIADRHQELSLRDEWRDFPFGNHDDRLDGLDMLLRTIRLAADRREIVVPLVSAS